MTTKKAKPAVIPWPSVLSREEVEAAISRACEDHMVYQAEKAKTACQSIISGSSPLTSIREARVALDESERYALALAELRNVASCRGDE